MPPSPYDLEEARSRRLAVRVTEGRNGPHPDLATILAYLKVYEDAGMPTGMAFWFNS